MFIKIIKSCYFQEKDLNYILKCYIKIQEAYWNKIFIMF